MYEVRKAETNPVNFFAGDYPIATDTAIVDAGAEVKQYEPVKLVAGKLRPVVFVAASAAQEYVAATAAVHTLVIAASVTAGDTITINGEVYTAVSADPVAADKEFVAGTASTAAASLKLALAITEAINFTIGGSSANITFTQKVAGIGDLPTLSTSATDTATISTTTPYVAGADPEPTKTAAENTAAGLYGIAADDAEAGDEVVVYLTGEYFASAIDWPENVTKEMLRPYFRSLGVFLK